MGLPVGKPQALAPDGAGSREGRKAAYLRFTRSAGRVGRAVVVVFQTEGGSQSAAAALWSSSAHGVAASSDERGHATSTLRRCRWAGMASEKNASDGIDHPAPAPGRSGDHSAPSQPWTISSPSLLSWRAWVLQTEITRIIGCPGLPARVDLISSLTVAATALLCSRSQMSCSATCGYLLGRRRIVFGGLGGSFGSVDPAGGAGRRSDILLHASSLNCGSRG
jgi:hypothetical protein